MGDTDPVEGLRDYLHAHDPSKRGPTFHHSDTDSRPSTHEVDDGIQPHLDGVERDEWPDPPDDLDADARRLLNRAREHGRVPLGPADDLVGDTFATLATLRERGLVSVDQSEATGVVLPVAPNENEPAAAGCHGVRRPVRGGYDGGGSPSTAAAAVSGDGSVALPPPSPRVAPLSPRGTR